MGALVYRFPSKKIKVVGVTGTEGKSTVVELISKILEEKGEKTALLSSIRFKIGKDSRANNLKMTMPGRMKIQKFLGEAVRKKCRYAILEVTSEGILQYRQKFINFNTVVFTGLSPEHIERHGSFEKYKKAKGKLFRQCGKTHVINIDDQYADYFLEFEAERKFVFSTKRNKLSIRGPVSLIEGKNLQVKEEGISFEVEGIVFDLNLLGEFNIYNALASLGVALSEDISLETSRTALQKIRKIPGRMEIVISKPFRVIVDYAHTPNSLEKVYQTLKSNYQFKKGSMICVLGSCGGGRDKWKRPKLGEIAAQNCDKIILTNEDPYDENPLKIIDEIQRGVSGAVREKAQIEGYQEVLDRKEAIKKALSTARPNDTIIITGKGSEPWMCVAGERKIPWDDREIVREEFNKLNNLRQLNKSDKMRNL